MKPKQLKANEEFLQLSRVYGAEFVQLIMQLREVDVDRLVRLMAAGYVPGIALDTLVEVAIRGMIKSAPRI